ncbi:alpha/beta hydrolase [Arthrobacter agilis]|uniref:alpha/beta hydrolase n=1 Tax=Arthrobacter agilis TaxID=37921 RepID=UPI00277E107C|nr:alpha/beta fold hydrolase [Arthrobacter agilis]MDQ0734161.1 alpha-beta hydrolase superfamily lysophospholipase [Arthrobacter agilis]
MAVEASRAGDRDPVVRVGGARTGVRAVALVLHGGRAESFDAVQPQHLSPLRMRPFAARLAAGGRAHGLAVWALRNRVRGWNGADQSALVDARWALDRIAAQHPAVPVYLLGHSMGGLTALYAAGHPQVRAVAALAPWLEPTSPVESVRGRSVLIMHGDTDRWTSPAASLSFARRAQAVARDVHYVRMLGAGHFMFRTLPVWHGLSTSFLLRHFAEDTGATLDARVLERSAALYRAPDPLGITA